MNRSTAALAKVMVLCLLLIAFSIALWAETTTSEHLSLERAGLYGHAPTFQVTLGDLDDDGDLDAVFANMHARSEIWMNDGSGHFTNAYQNIGGEAHGVSIGDWDGDGDLDLVLTPASESAASRLYFNDGSGAFAIAAHDLGDTSIAANSVSLFDVEGDGDLDIGVYYYARQRHSRLYVNDGAGRFATTDMRLPGLAAWGDVDGDGDVDAVCIQHEQNGSGYKVFQNIGDIEFEESQHISALGDFFPGSTALGDIDGDGDLDLVASGGDAPLTCLVNNGAGGFAVDPASAFSSSSGRITLGDFNGDGAVDAMIGCLERPNLIALSDHVGGFIHSGLLLGGNDMEGISAVGDLDGDGDLDLFIAIYGQGGPNVVWLNTTE